jgi:hypothetical protein
MINSKSRWFGLLNNYVTKNKNIQGMKTRNFILNIKFYQILFKIHLKINKPIN